MAETSLTRLSMPEPDIAVITFDDPNKSANVLSRSVLEEFAAHLDKLDQNKNLAGLILRSGKPGTFIAGADLREFVAWIEAPREEVLSVCRRGHELFGRLATIPCVTVAAIDGLCLGGGAEMVCWCDRRLMTNDPRTSLGFPEVKLGLFPGWGGTARVPRIVGLSNAIELISTGEEIDGQAARAMGLATDVVEPAGLEKAAIALVRAEQQSGQFREDRRLWSAPIDIDETELGFLGATASAYIQQQTKGHYPAPLAALEVMLGGAGCDLEQACQMEAEGFIELFGTPINRALLNLFFLRDANKKDPGVDRADVKTRPIKSVAVIGAGIMGQGIASANVRREVPVALTDVSEEAIAKGVQGILNEVSYNKKTKAPDVERAVQLAPLVNGTRSDVEIAACDLVIEAVIENLEAKKELYARLEGQLAEHAILASNTSTIPITRLAADLAHPERFCGIHFFNPVRRMPLVEVIRGEKTSDETVATAVAYAKALGKSPVVVMDGPGFLVNRLLLPYMNEALELILDGADIKSVERASKDFGMPMGPITLFDVVGIDTAVHAGRVMYEAFPKRVVPSELLTAVFKAGRLGQKSGGGFFNYDGKRGRPTPSPEAEAIIQQRRRQQQTFTNEQLTERMFLPMVVEATLLLEERLVRNPRDVDLGLVFGIGFPPFKGGLLFWADTLGAKKIVETLKPYAAIGPRYQPTDMLLDMAKTGKKFYDEGENS